MPETTVPTQVVHVSKGINYLLEVTDTPHCQCYQKLKTSINRSRSAAHWDGLLGGKLSTFHVLKVHIRCWEDEVINQLLVQKEMKTPLEFCEKGNKEVNLLSLHKCLNVVP